MLRLKITAWCFQCIHCSKYEVHESHYKYHNKLYRLLYQSPQVQKHLRRWNACAYPVWLLQFANSVGGTYLLTVEYSFTQLLYNNGIIVRLRVRHMKGKLFHLLYKMRINTYFHSDFWYDFGLLNSNNNFAVFSYHSRIYFIGQDQHPISIDI